MCLRTFLKGIFLDVDGKELYEGDIVIHPTVTIFSVKHDVGFVESAELCSAYGFLNVSWLNSSGGPLYKSLYTTEQCRHMLKKLDSEEYVLHTLASISEAR